MHWAELITFAPPTLVEVSRGGQDYQMAGTGRVFFTTDYVMLIWGPIPASNGVGGGQDYRMAGTGRVWNIFLSRQQTCLCMHDLHGIYISWYKATNRMWNSPSWRQWPLIRFIATTVFDCSSLIIKLVFIFIQFRFLGNKLVLPLISAAVTMGIVTPYKCNILSSEPSGGSSQ